MTGGRDSSLPGRRAKMLPILSTVMRQPAASPHCRNRSRAWRSRSVSARRQTPPFSVAPILASSIRLCHSRSLSMRILVLIDSPPFALAPSPPPRPAPVEGAGEEGKRPLKFPSPLAGEGQGGGCKRPNLRVLELHRYSAALRIGF